MLASNIIKKGKTMKISDSFVVISEKIRKEIVVHLLKTYPSMEIYTKDITIHWNTIVEANDPILIDKVVLMKKVSAWVDGYFEGAINR